jgi:hypothetical protein
VRGRLRTVVRTLTPPRALGEVGLRPYPALLRGMTAARWSAGAGSKRDRAVHRHAEGQLFALQKADVDFDAGLILVSRSHNLPSGSSGPRRS